MKVSRFVVMLFASLFVAAASAQDKYPSRPITVVVPYASGTTTDLIARAFAPKLQEILGEQKKSPPAAKVAGGRR